MKQTGWIKRVFLGVLAAGFIPFAWAGPAEQMFENAWDWHLPPRKYGKLSQEERVQFGRAETMIRDGQYEAAALEFEKFITAYPKTDAYAQALLLQGFGYHLGNFRNKAIERYNEVLDFFKDSPDAAVPAGYLKAMALIQNGNLEQGYAVLQAITDNDANLENPLADLALVKLADYYLSKQDPKKADRCWHRVVEAYKNAFFGRPEAAAIMARQKLIDLYCQQGRFADVDDLLVLYPLEGKKTPDSLNFVVERGLAVYDTIPEKTRKPFFDWFRSRRADYEKEGREGEWHGRLLTVGLKGNLKNEWASAATEALAFFKSRADKDAVAGAAGMVTARFCEAENAAFKPDWKSFVEALTAQCGKLDAGGQLATATAVLNAFSTKLGGGTQQDIVWDSMIARCKDLYLKMMNPEKDNGLASLVDRLRNVRQFDRAMEIVMRMESPPMMLWKEIEILGAKEQFAEQAKKCEELEQMDDKGYSSRALKLRAQLYKDRLAKYDEAIKLFAMINEPPWTIWNTSECYERWGKPDSAVNALTEIENFFERDAPQAAYRKAEIWDRAKDKAKTVAALRAVIKKYPKAQVSSQAHQMLERYGVSATGGGVVDED